MPVKKIACVSCGAKNHPNCRTCPSCGNACKRKRGRPRGEVGDTSRGVKPVEVNRSESETVRPQHSTQPPVGCNSASVSDPADPYRSVTDDPSHILLNSQCQQSLVRKRGRPTKTSDEYSTKPCPSCGEQNSLLNSVCDHCQQSLVCKRGRPTKTSLTKPCPSCGEQNSLLNSLCDHCQQSLVCKGGRPTKVRCSSANDPADPHRSVTDDPSHTCILLSSQCHYIPSPNSQKRIRAAR